MSDTLGAPDQFSIKKHVIFAIVIMGSLVFGVGGWAATANLMGAVVASGTFVVERSVKKVQHSFGGIISELRVKNGDRVAAGDVIIRLDPTQIRAELGVVKSQVIELTARSARLVAESDGRPKIVFPSGFVESSPDAAEAAAGEVRLFEESRKAKEGQREQLRLKIEQTKNEIVGLTSQKDAKEGEHEVIRRELTEVRELFKKGLALATKLNQLERDSKRLSGEHGGLTAQVARAHAQISEINVQILNIDENTRAVAQRDLRSTDAKLSELREKEIAAADKLNRIDIRAPITGMVHELSVHTVGGVVTSAEQLMLIVPEDDSLAILARVQPQDISLVSLGGAARLRLSAFDQKTTPELDGRVVHVPGDISNDPKTGQSYYSVRVEIDEKSRKLMSGLKLIPGMPVEVFLLTGERTPIEYLTKSFVDQVKRTWRESR